MRKTLLIIVATLLLVSNLFYVVTSPAHTLVNVFLLLCLVWIAQMKVPCKKEKYDGYDYDAENPNALITGENVAGTVFASHPEQAGGITWIL
jgi:hypothetical protein